MINVLNNTPSVYSSSRDFQTISRLYTALFNASKYYSDSINYLNDSHDSTLAEYKAKTVNFDTKREWESDILEAVSTSFKYIMKRKGTRTAIEYCINILLRLYNIYGTDIMVTSKELFDSGEYSKNTSRYLCTNYIYIIIPKALATVGIVKDLLDYVLPIGIRYRIIEYIKYNNVIPDLNSEVSDEISSNTNVQDSDVTIYNNKDQKTGYTTSYNKVVNLSNET